MILVSACLLGRNCKYSGGNNRNEAVIKYLEGKAYITCCPECDGGLPTPRLPSERLGDKVVSSAGTDVSAQFEKGAAIALRLAQEHGADTAILKERSPSCGVRAIYDGSFSGAKVPGQGVTAQLLSKHGLQLLTEEDIEQMLREG